MLILQASSAATSWLTPIFLKKLGQQGMALIVLSAASLPTL
jgi:hypothetical protein